MKLSELVGHGGQHVLPAPTAHGRRSLLGGSAGGSSCDSAQRVERTAAEVAAFPAVVREMAGSLVWRAASGCRRPQITYSFASAARDVVGAGNLSDYQRLPRRHQGYAQAALDGIQKAVNIDFVELFGPAGTQANLRFRFFAGLDAITASLTCLEPDRCVITLSETLHSQLICDSSFSSSDCRFVSQLSYPVRRELLHALGLAPPAAAVRPQLGDRFFRDGRGSLFFGDVPCDTIQEAAPPPLDLTALVASYGARTPSTRHVIVSGESGLGQWGGIRLADPSATLVMVDGTGVTGQPAQRWQRGKPHRL